MMYSLVSREWFAGRAYLLMKPSEPVVGAASTEEPAAKRPAAIAKKDFMLITGRIRSGKKLLEA
jgi:hypothetical protein